MMGFVRISLLRMQVPRMKDVSSDFGEEFVGISSGWLCVAILLAALGERAAECVAHLGCAGSEQGSCLRRGGDSAYAAPLQANGEGASGYCQGAARRVCRNKHKQSSARSGKKGCMPLQNVATQPCSPLHSVRTWANGKRCLLTVHAQRSHRTALCSWC